MIKFKNSFTKVWIGTDERRAKFKPRNWSVWKRPFRTNNDVEGFHNRIKRVCGNSRVNFYRFLGIIANEMVITNLNLALISEGRILRINKKNERIKDSKIISLSNKYEERTITTMSFLKRLSQIY